MGFNLTIFLYLFHCQGDILIFLAFILPSSNYPNYFLTGDGYVGVLQNLSNTKFAILAKYTRIESPKVCESPKPAGSWNVRSQNWILWRFDQNLLALFVTKFAPHWLLFRKNIRTIILILNILIYLNTYRGFPAIVGKQWTVPIQKWWWNKSLSSSIHCNFSEISNLSKILY